MSVAHGPRRGAVLVGALLVLALGVGTWWLLRDDGSVGDATALRPDPPAADAVASLPVPLDDAASPVDSASLPHVARAQPALLDAPSPLALSVRHAHGPAAVGGVVALYDAEERLLASGVLDEQGHWRDDGHDSAAEVYVIGLSPEPGRLSLAEARGVHELVLPEGAWLEGQVTIDDAAPGFAFPLDLRGARQWMTVRWSLPQRGEGVPDVAAAGRHHGALGAAYAAPDGHFLVSGFPMDEFVTLSVPEAAYTRDAEHSSPASVRVPFDGYRFALRSKPMIRGRVVRTDGAAAPGAKLTLTQTFRRLEPLPSAAVSLTTMTHANGHAADEDGRFSIPIDLPDSVGCMDAQTGRLRASVDCGPVVLTVGLHALTAGGAAGSFAGEGLDPTLSAECGDIVLREADPRGDDG